MLIGFDCCFVSGDASDNDVAIISRGLLTSNNEVTIHNANTNHAFSANTQHEEISVTSEVRW